jgi:15-cis-phytoene synthase
MNSDFELALAHTPARVRPAMQALFEIDSAMADVVARSTEPTLGRIKLAWWREQLEALDHGPPPAEPRLKAVAEHLLPAGISGAGLAELEAGWATLLDADPDPALVAGRGATLFELGGRLLGASDPKLADAGALYALSSAGVLERAREHLDRLRGHRFSRALRPLTMLARAAAYQGEGRGRVLAMLAHRWSGRIG